MTDHVIVDKQKYDSVLSENSDLKAKIERNTIHIQLSSGYSRGYKDPYPNYYYYEMLTFGSDIPGELVATFEAFKEQIENSKKELGDYKKKLDEAIIKAGFIKDERLKKEKELNDKLESIHPIVKWWFNIKTDKK